MTARPRPTRDASAGFTLIEMMIALIVLSVGIVAVSRLFPAATRGQSQDRLQAAASYYAQEKLEWVSSLPSGDSRLAPGRYPASGYESCTATGPWRRFYTVQAMAAPLADLERVDVTVTWATSNGRDVVVTTYLRP